jgi:hypothetical protein
MKNLIFLAICVLFFNSCGTAYVNGLARQYYNTNQKIVNVSTIADNQDITIYYLNEKIEKPHLKVAVFEAVGGVNASYANLILNLKTNARLEGVDAISIVKQNISQRNDVDIEGFSILTSMKEVVAYGIIYEENLRLTNRFPKNETVYGYNSFKKEYEQLAVKTLDINGLVIKTEGNDNMSKIVRPYSVKHLLTDTENWEFYEENNVVQMRIYRNQLRMIKKCTFEYDSIGNVSEIYIEVTLHKPDNIQTIDQKVKLKYDEQGRLFRKLIYPNVENGIIHYEEIFTYKNDQLKEKVLYSINDKNRNPLAKFVYSSYYKIEELKNIFPELR